MKRIILKIDEAMARKWNTLSLEQQQLLTRQFEQLISRLSEDEDNSGSMKDAINEPSTTYEASTRKEMKKREKSEQEKTSLSEEEQELRAQKVWDFFENLSADFTGYKFDRNEANER